MTHSIIDLSTALYTFAASALRTFDTPVATSCGVTALLNRGMVFITAVIINLMLFYAGYPPDDLVRRYGPWYTVYPCAHRSDYSVACERRAVARVYESWDGWYVAAPSAWERVLLETLPRYLNGASFFDSEPLDVVWARRPLKRATHAYLRYSLSREEDAVVELAWPLRRVRVLPT